MPIYITQISSYQYLILPFFEKKFDDLTVTPKWSKAKWQESIRRLHININTSFYEPIHQLRTIKSNILSNESTDVATNNSKYFSWKYVWDNHIKAFSFIGRYIYLFIAISDCCTKSISHCHLANFLFNTSVAGWTAESHIVFVLEIGVCLTRVYLQGSHFEYTDIINSHNKAEGTFDSLSSTWNMIGSFNTRLRFVFNFGWILAEKTQRRKRRDLIFAKISKK